MRDCNPLQIKKDILTSIANGHSHQEGRYSYGEREEDRTLQVRAYEDPNGAKSNNNTAFIIGYNFPTDHPSHGETVSGLQKLEDILDDIARKANLTPVQAQDTDAPLAAGHYMVVSAKPDALRNANTGQKSQITEADHAIISDENVVAKSPASPSSTQDYTDKNSLIILHQDNRTVFMQAAEKLAAEIRISEAGRDSGSLSP